MSVLGSIPVEVVINILLFLETHSIVRVIPLVNRTFNAAATHDNTVWKILCFRRFRSVSREIGFEAPSHPGRPGSDWPPAEEETRPTPESLFATLGQWKAVFLQLPPPPSILSYDESRRNMKTADLNTHLRVTVTWDGQVRYSEQKRQYLHFDRRYRLSIANHEDFLTRLRAAKNSLERTEYVHREYLGGLYHCDFRLRIEGDDFALDRRSPNCIGGLLEFLKELAPEEELPRWSPSALRKRATRDSRGPGTKKSLLGTYRKSSRRE